MSSGNRGPLLEARNLCVTFPIPGRRARLGAVEGVDVELHAGETVALVGESGSGKSTLARALAGLQPVDRGNIRLRPPGAAGTSAIELTSLPARRLRPHRRHLQMVFQDAQAAFDPRWRIGASIAEPMRCLRLVQGSPSLRARVSELLAQVGLDPVLADRLPHELSGGQRQRAGIARALAARPALLLLDEVVSALDVSLSAQIIELLLELRRREGVALLFITHDLAVARAIADRVAVMLQGRIVETGQAADIFERPEHPYTRALLDAALIPDPVRQRARGFRTMPGEPLPLGTTTAGCVYASRCPVAEPRCHDQPPAWRPIGARHQARCHLAGEVRSRPGPQKSE